LNIYTTASENEAFPATATVKNVEVVNVYNAGAAAALSDASKFEGVTELWQHGTAAAVTNLAVGTTAGFKTTQAGALSAAGAANAASVTVALDAVKDADLTDGNTITLNVSGAAVNAVNVSGTIAAGTNTPATKALTIAVITGKDQKTITVNTAIDATVTVDENAGNTVGVFVTAVNFAASAGAVTFAGDADTATITTGAGDDVVTISAMTVKDDAATVADETVTATVTTGAGDDMVTVNTSGTGVTSVSTGDGDDMVDVTARGTTLKVDMGAGDDSFTSAVAITSKDTIDAGEGSDTLLLSLVGAANVGAFKNFDVYDVKGMTAALDLDILNTNNTATEIVGSAALGDTVTLLNVTTNFRATGDMNANILTLTQKTAGALTVTLDADQTVAGAGDDVADTSVAASNATTVAAVFAADYLAVAGEEAGETAATDNQSTITLATVAATAVTVTSGGTNATNNLVLSDTVTGGTAKGVLATLTITGAQDINVTYTPDADGSALATVNASALTGDLTMSLAGLKDGATLKLGSGQDTITVTNTSTTGGVESIENVEKTAAVAVSAVAGDAVAKAAAIADADVLVLTGATAADANGAVLTATIADGVLTFTGAGPATFADAIVIANNFANADGETALFEYIGNSYVFVQGGAEADTVVKLVGITGVTDFVESTTADQFFIV
jgi:hypothetical protein